MTAKTKMIIVRAIIAAVLAACSVIGAAVGLTSCSATRTITTKAECIQKGDSSVVIQTKTTEQYTGKKRM